GWLGRPRSAGPRRNVGLASAPQACGGGGALIRIGPACDDPHVRAQVAHLEEPLELLVDSWPSSVEQVFDEARKVDSRVRPPRVRDDLEVELTGCCQLE